MATDISIAAVVPCYNEELTVGRVIEGLKKALPEARVYVIDNGSTDGTALAALEAGAEVLKEKRRGKGFAVQAMFRKVEADYFVMVDGDDTYDLSRLRDMLSLVMNEEADMVVGNRLKDYSSRSFRAFHTFGNKLIRSLINRLFGASLKDILSGFRVMNRDFVKNINVMSPGFEVETELTIKALKYRFMVKEVDIRYGERPEGSYSKLNTFRDGLLVLSTIFSIFRDYKPLLFFSLMALFFLLVSIATGFVVVGEFIRTRFITHVPLAILASGSMVLSIICFVTGVMLDSANRRFDELYNLIRNR